MRKLLVVLPVLLALAGGCDATRRDFTYCNATYSECGKGKTCNLATGTCGPDVDAGAIDTSVSEDGPVDLAEGEAALPPDAKDAPAVIDVSPVDTSPLDTSIIDAPQSVDAAIPDTRVPDASGTCAVDNDCIGVASGPNCVNFKCVACKTSSQCNNDAGVPFCSAQSTCVSCAGISGPDGGSACPTTAPVCAASGSCVECVSNSNCPQSGGKAFCVQNKCQGCNAPGATASGPASGGADGGSADGGGIDGGAPDGGASSDPCTVAKLVCAKSGTIAGQCVGCETIVTDGGLPRSNCDGTTPICNSANTCVACTSDTQCSDKGVGPGVCMFHQDGRCASDAETIYVKNTAGCTGGAGTLASPYCQPQAGIGAVTASKRVVVLIGPSPFGVWTATLSGPQVSVLGQNGATVGPNSDTGVHIASGNVYIRGLTVQGIGMGAASPGIVVDSGATIGLNRCVVKGNAGGILVRDDAGFDIANSIFAQNQSGSVPGTATIFGGVYLGRGGNGLPTRFWYNTLVENQPLGVSCTITAQLLDAVLFADIGGEVANCTVAATSKSSTLSPSGVAGKGFTTTVGGPMLDSAYHLTLSSPCKDFIVATSTNHPPDDIDGDVRPKPANGKLDCGADEF